MNVSVDHKTLLSDPWITLDKLKFFVADPNFDDKFSVKQIWNICLYQVCAPVPCNEKIQQLTQIGKA